MQIGHVAVACVIASFAPELTGGRIEAFSGEALAVAFLAHWLPNLDSIPIWLKWAKPNFHCTWSHTFLFAFLVALLLAPFDVGWALLAFSSLLLHYAADLPSTIGLPLFLPFTWKRFSLRLWADTGAGTWTSMKGTYQQSWTWILEGGAFVVLFIRAYQVGAWPFA